MAPVKSQGATATPPGWVGWLAAPNGGESDSELTDKEAGLIFVQQVLRARLEGGAGANALAFVDTAMRQLRESLGDPTHGHPAPSIDAEDEGRRQVEIGEAPSQPLAGTSLGERMALSPESEEFVGETSPSELAAAAGSDAAGGHRPPPREDIDTCWQSTHAREAQPLPPPSAPMPAPSNPPQAATPAWDQVARRLSWQDGSRPEAGAQLRRLLAGGKRPHNGSAVRVSRAPGRPPRSAGGTSDNIETTPEQDSALATPSWCPPAAPLATPSPPLASGPPCVLKADTMSPPLCMAPGSAVVTLPGGAGCAGVLLRRCGSRLVLLGAGEWLPDTSGAGARAKVALWELRVPDDPTLLSSCTMRTSLAATDLSHRTSDWLDLTSSAGADLWLAHPSYVQLAESAPCAASPGVQMSRVHSAAGCTEGEGKAAGNVTIGTQGPVCCVKIAPWKAGSGQQCVLAAGEGGRLYRCVLDGGLPRPHCGTATALPAARTASVSALALLPDRPGEVVGYGPQGLLGHWNYWTGELLAAYAPQPQQHLQHLVPLAPAPGGAPPARRDLLPFLALLGARGGGDGGGRSSGMRVTTAVARGATVAYAPAPDEPPQHSGMAPSAIAGSCQLSVVGTRDGRVVLGSVGGGGEPGGVAQAMLRLGASGRREPIVDVGVCEPSLMLAAGSRCGRILVMDLRRLGTMAPLHPTGIQEARAV